MKSADSATAGERQRWQSVQESYDTIAAEYARRIYPELKDKPFDRDWLDRFAELVRNRSCM